MIYSFAGVTLPMVTTVSAPIPARVPTLETPGRAGSFAGRRRVAERSVGVSGVLNGTAGQTYDDLCAAFAAFASALSVDTPQTLYITPGYSLLALPENIQDTKRAAAYIEYEITFRCSDPFYYADAVSVVALSTTGGTATNADYAPALPAISITTTAAGGRVTLANAATGETCSFAPDAADTYILDSQRETLKRSGLDVIFSLSGGFLTLLPGANVLTVTASGGASVSVVSASWKGRRL